MSQRTDSQGWWSAKWLRAGWLIPILGFLIYISGIRNQLFWDDFDFITNNVTVHSLSNIPLFFSQSVIAGSGLVSNYFRPILMVLFSLEWLLFKNWGGGYHLVSLVLHITDAYLIYWLLRRLWKSPWLSLLPALLFLVHPLQVETVAYANSQGDALSVLWMLMGLVWWQVREQRLAKLPTSKLSLSRSTLISGVILSVCYGLALLSKESAIIFPGLVALLATFAVEQRQHFSWRRWLMAMGCLVLPLLIIGLGYVGLRATVWNFQNSLNLYNTQNEFTQNFSVRLFTFWRAQTSYWRLLILPFPLFMERSLAWVNTWRAPLVWLGAIGSIGSVALALVAWRRWPVLTFAIGWFWLAFFPFSNLVVPINGILYEHFMYLPMVGVWIGFGAVVLWLVTHYPRARQFWLMFVSFVIVLCTILSVWRVQDWHDPVTFYLNNLRYTPTSYRIVNNLGMAYADKGDWEAAKVMYERATRLDPTNAVAWHNLGNMEVNHGSTVSAERHFRQALSLQPSFLFSARALAQLYLNANNLAAAQPWLVELAKAAPQDIDLWTVLMKVAAARQDWEMAGTALAHLRQLQPSNLQWWQAQQELDKLQHAAGSVQ